MNKDNFKTLASNRQINVTRKDDMKKLHNSRYMYNIIILYFETLRILLPH